MKIFSINSTLITILLLISALVQIHGKNVTERKTCFSRRTPCFLKTMTCPAQCPSTKPKDPKAKVCYMNCDSPICKAECKNRKPNCNAPGAACLDPRFIGGDGIVFYFHGKSGEHFSLVSDPNLQINGRFIGLRPAGRTRDYTWIQAIGVLFGSETFSLEAKHAATWDEEFDHLKFSYNGNDIFVPEGHLSSWESPESHLSPWESPESGLTIERTSDKNSVLVTLPDIAEISVNVVPVTREDDRIHNYRIPSDNCFAHLELQFKFHGLSSNVEGVLGRTYQPDFASPAKPGIAMPVVGGEDKYRTSSLVSADCHYCIFSPITDQRDASRMEFGTLDCTSAASSGNGIVCRR